MPGGQEASAALPTCSGKAERPLTSQAPSHHPRTPGFSLEVLLVGSVAFLISPAQLKPRGEKSLVQLPLDHSGSDSSPGRRRAPVIAHSFIEVYLPGCYGLFYGETRGLYKNTGSASGCVTS